MTSTDKAKAFIANKLKRSALIILPLAAAAVQAHAGVIFTLGSGGSNPMQASGGNVVTTVTTPFSSTQILNGVNGISLFGAANYGLSGGGVGSSGGACQNVCAGFFISGTGSGSFDSDTLLTNYDFTITDNNGDPLYWWLEVDINGEQSDNHANGLTAAGGQEVTGTLMNTGLNGVTLTNWAAFLHVDYGAGYESGDVLTVNVPGGASVDIGVASTTPEPGTGLLALGGAVLFGLRSIRRRRA